MAATPLLPPDGGSATADGILDRFVAWAGAQGLELYPAQEEAVLELLAGKHLVLATPTGSGKSLVATALVLKARAEGKRIFYTCPIKALVNEKFFALCQAFGAEKVGMLTGDAQVNRDAPIVCCTAEILANLALRDPRAASYVVMDEFHYYGDRDRGVAWQLPLLALEDTTFLLMSATLGDTREIEKRLEDRTGREVAVVKSAERPVPLDYEYRETPLHETIEHLLTTGRYPIYLVHFTQRACAEQAQNLMSVDFCTKEEKEQLRQALFGVPMETPYGKELAKFLKHGVGLHHAGLLPRYRLLVEKLSQQGLLKVICGTDTLGVGVNIPIRTVLFTQLCKFDGEKTSLLTARDFHQIAGRAGRKGFDDRGSVVAQAPEHVIENKKLEAKAAAGKKVVKRQPPQKGYVHFDRSTFEKLVGKEPEALEPRFEISHGLLLALLQGGRFGYEGYRKLLGLIALSHVHDHGKKRLKRQAAARFRQLRQAGIVEVVRWEGRHGSDVVVSEKLQDDFSIHHSLALWLLSTVPLLDRASETYALDLLTLVESMLENPDVVLWKQLDRLKGEKVAELKAKGVEYDERMAELEKLEHPKPLADFVYATFNEFSRTRPWLGHENIRPKSVAREMYEKLATFDDYVRDYGLQRSEGVVLRYLSEVYKTLVQSVPEGARDDAVLDVIAYLRALVRGTDPSLLEEWERLRDGVEATPAAAAPVARVRDLASDERALGARIRRALHAIVKALADGRLEDARRLLAPGEVEWTDAALAEALAAYRAEHGPLSTTPAARRPNLTHVTREGPRTFTVRHQLVDPEGDLDWMLDGVVELPEPVPEDGPLFALRRIGV